MKHLLLLLMLGWFSLPAFSACELYDLEVDKLECNHEQKFMLIINFKYHDVSDCFTIKGNGKNYGTFKYNQLPVKLTLAGDCKTEYEFVIRDCHTESCKLTYFLGKECCELECELSDLHVEKKDCDKEQNFCIVLNFNYQGNSKFFKLYDNQGKYYGKFGYNQLPLTICGIKGDCETDYEFEVRDSENENCSTSAYLGIVCCEEPCKLNELKLEKSECDKNGKFYVFLNFLHKNTSDCFKVFLNGNWLGTFEYNQLPLKLGPFDGDCKTHYEFKILDCEDEHCNVAGNLGIVCCEKKECMIHNLRIEKTKCDKELNFYIYLNFSHKNTSSCFQVKGNGKDYGTFDYSQLPVKIGPLKGDCKTHYEFVVIDCDNEHCRASKAIGRVCCEEHKKEKHGEFKADHKGQTNGYEAIENGSLLVSKLGQELLLQPLSDYILRAEVFDLYGNHIRSINFGTGRNSYLLNLNDKPYGLYLLRYRDESGLKVLKLFQN